MTSEEHDSRLIALIDDLLHERLTFDQFDRPYSNDYIDAPSFANEDREEFFGDVHERLEWTATEVDDTDRGDGYISVPEFKEWLSVKRSRYPAVDSSSSTEGLALGASDAHGNSDGLEVRLTGLIDSFLDGNGDWSSFAEGFVKAWRQGFAAIHAQVDALPGSQRLTRYGDMVETVMPFGRRRVFGQVLDLRKFAMLGDVDEKARRWGWMTTEEATQRLRELRSRYRDEFGI